MNKNFFFILVLILSFFIIIFDTISASSCLFSSRFDDCEVVITYYGPKFCMTYVELGQIRNECHLYFDSDRFDAILREQSKSEKDFKLNKSSPVIFCILILSIILTIIAMLNTILLVVKSNCFSKFLSGFLMILNTVLLLVSTIIWFSVAFGSISNERGSTDYSSVGFLGLVSGIFSLAAIFLYFRVKTIEQKLFRIR